MQLKISRNNKGLPFDEHKFSNIFSKLYNRLFVMEDYKYLPPKFSYSLKDLATDYGVFERGDVASVISGSSNMTMTTASGFNVPISGNNAGDTPKMKADRSDALNNSFPLSPIKEHMTESNSYLHGN